MNLKTPTLEYTTDLSIYLSLCVCPRMMYATFNYNYCATINASDETDAINFYNELYFLIRHFPKHSSLIIGGAMNPYIGKNENNKCCFTTLRTKMENINPIFQIFQKKKRKLWSYTYPNSSKVQFDIFINKKLIKNALNCEAYSSFKGVSSDHRIISVKILLSQYRNKKQTDKALRYHWSSIANNDICNHRRNTYKKSRSNTLVCSFLQGIWFHTQRKGR